MIKDADQSGTCDEGTIPRGHICIMRPNNHACFTGSIAFMCPGGDNDMVISQKFNTHCQVCDGMTADLGDIDHRAGYIEVKISWVNADAV
jgi:hypothetical protein